MPISFFISIAFIHLLAVMTPGPDFILLTQTALMRGRGPAVKVMLGIALGNFIHLTYCVLGFALVLKRFPFMFEAIKFLGAAYLFYLGIKGLILTGRSHLDQSQHEEQKKLASPLVQGFLCNLTNIKAMLYFIGVFSLAIKPSWPWSWQVLLGLEMLIITCAWFGSLALLISRPGFRKRLLARENLLNRLLSIALILFALFIIFYEIR